MDRRLYEEIKRGSATSAGAAVTTFKDQIDNDAQRTPNNNTVLHVAATFGRGETAAKILQLCPSLLTRANSKGETALHIAAKGGHLQAQDLVEEEDEEGWSPLHHAAKKGNVEAIRQILGVNKTAAYRRAGRQDDDGGWTTAVHIAASHGHSKVLKEIFSHCPDCCEMVNSKSQNFLHVTILNNESPSGLVFVALGSMILAFVTGAYAVLSNTIGLAITVCLIGCSAALMHFYWMHKIPSASSGSEELDEVICGHIKERIKIDASEAELLERSLLWLSRRHIVFCVRL
nr:protein ACCELERATED CELL DEATH 6-like [Ipomoea trifida]